MEKVKIKTHFRQEAGKEIAKKIRKESLVPAVVYSKDINMPIQVPLPSLKVLKNIHFSESTIIDMDIEGYKNKDNPISVLIKDVQYNPVTEEVIHLDFMKVSLKERIKVKVPVNLKGECIGVKEGGVLEQMLWEVELEALPLDIPEKIELDVSDLAIGHSIHVEDLTLNPNIKILDSPKDTIVTVVVMKEEVEEVAPVEEVQEPEVIKEKEKEEKEEKEEGKEKEVKKEKEGKKES